MTEAQAKQSNVTVNTTTGNGAEADKTPTATSGASASTTARRIDDGTDDYDDEDSRTTSAPRSSNGGLASLQSSPHFEQLQKQLADENVAATQKERTTPTAAAPTDAQAEERTQQRTASQLQEERHADGEFNNNTPRL